MNWKNYQKPLIQIALVSGLLMTGFAQHAEAFKPRVEPLKGSTSTSGVRGNCNGRSVQDLSAIAPVSYTAQLTKEHSTVTWYIPEAYGSAIRLHLYRADNPNADDPKWLAVDTFTVSEYQPGIYSYPLPPHLLTEGQVYAWQVEVGCNPRNPSMNPQFSAQFRVVSAPSVAGKSAAEKAQFYADQGLWYGAYAEATIADQQGQRLRSKLLASLQEVEAEQIRLKAQKDPQSNAEEVDRQVQHRREQLRYLIQMVQ